MGLRGARSGRGTPGDTGAPGEGPGTVGKGPQRSAGHTLRGAHLKESLPPYEQHHLNFPVGLWG